MGKQELKGLEEEEQEELSRKEVLLKAGQVRKTFPPSWPFKVTTILTEVVEIRCHAQGRDAGRKWE